MTTTTSEKEKLIKGLEPGQLKVHFRPVIDARDRATVAYYCVPYAKTQEDDLMVGDEFVEAGSMGKKLDAEVLSKNVRRLVRSISTQMMTKISLGTDAQVIVPINAEAMTLNSVASALAEECRQVEKAAMSMVTFEAVHFPKGHALSILDDLAILLYPFSDRYIGRPPSGSLDFTSFANTNFAGVTFDLKNKAWPVDKVRPFLENFTTSAKNNRLSTYLHGVGTPEIASLAEELGYDFVDGDAIEGGEASTVNLG